MQIRVGRHHTRENPRIIHSRNGHPKSPAGAPIKGWYPHSSTSIRHRKGTWGKHQAHEADTRPNTHTSNINHWCGQQQQEPQAVWKLWRHSCPTQVPGIRYNVLPVPQKESLAPGMPLGQQRHNQHRRRTGSACQSFNEANEEAWMVTLPPRTSPPGNSHRHRRQRWWCCQWTGMPWILVHREEQRWQPWRTLRQSGHPVQAPGVPESKGVNTGAQGNILPLHIFHRMFPEKLAPNGYPAEGTTKKRQTILQAYNGTTIKQLGVITLSCKHKDTEWHSSDFFVTESEGPAILGLPSSRQLRLVTIHCMVQTATTPATQPIHDAMDLKRLYPDRFSRIGDFEGELHITHREDAQPVVQPPWKYPIQLLEEIRTELEKMEDLGVITSITEPTDWVNALAFSRKASGGLRVCLDPRSLNQCIKRTHHKTPTLEEITNRLSGSKVFSKLDAKHGYWSIKLDEESSKLTTFNSPIGHFRFKRLPFGLNVSQDAFQQCMDQILSQCPGTIGITDNVIVHGKDDKDHDRNLHHLMKVAQKCGLVFNAAKCFIKTPQIKFSLEWFMTLMACTLTWKSALKSKQSPLQRMSQKFSSFSA